MRIGGSASAAALGLRVSLRVDEREPRSQGEHLRPQASGRMAARPSPQGAASPRVRLRHRTDDHASAAILGLRRVGDRSRRAEHHLRPEASGSGGPRSHGAQHHRPSRCRATGRDHRVGGAGAPSRRRAARVPAADSREARSGRDAAHHRAQRLFGVRAGELALEGDRRGQVLRTRAARAPGGRGAKRQGEDRRMGDARSPDDRGGLAASAATYVAQHASPARAAWIRRGRRPRRRAGVRALQRPAAHRQCQGDALESDAWSPVRPPRIRHAITWWRRSGRCSPSRRQAARRLWSSAAIHRTPSTAAASCCEDCLRACPPTSSGSSRAPTCCAGCRAGREAPTCSPGRTSRSNHRCRITRSPASRSERSTR